MSALDFQCFSIGENCVFCRFSMKLNPYYVLLNWEGSVQENEPPVCTGRHMAKFFLDFLFFFKWRQNWGSGTS